MSSLRSKQGCWTCRLRKKKCDESRPTCSLCQTLSVTCYGYGPKPDWMDGGQREKAVADAIKQSIKTIPRRKPLVRSSTIEHVPHQLAPKVSVSVNDSELSLKPMEIDTAPQKAEAEPHGPELKNPGSSHLNIFGAKDDLMAFSLTAEDSVLLMHFLDDIFPLQFPAYHARLEGGGRGWLLSLLLRTRPLFHAALALSSYHRRVALFTSASVVCKPCYIEKVVQQESHLEKCLTEFQDTIKTVQKFVKDKGAEDEAFEAEFSIIQLIYFELVASETNSWRRHLTAMSDMFEILCSSCPLSHHNISEQSRMILSQNLNITSEPDFVIQEVSSYRFMIGSALWLDMVSSVTSGTVPRLFHHHFEILITRSQIKMQDIMGAENWVVLQLGRIASLHAERERDQQEGRIGQMWEGEYRRKSEDIQRAVEFGLSKSTVEVTETSPFRILASRRSKAMQAQVTSRLFALSLLVYLHLVNYGFADLQLIESHIGEAVMLLIHHVENELLPVLIMPLFLIASVGRCGSEIALFRSIFAERIFLEPLFKHRFKVMDTVEAIWRKRNGEIKMVWGDATEISKDLVLL